MLHNIYTENAVNCILKQRLTAVGHFSCNKSQVKKGQVTEITLENILYKAELLSRAGKARLRYKISYNVEYNLLENLSKNIL